MNNGFPFEKMCFSFLRKKKFSEIKSSVRKVKIYYLARKDFVWVVKQWCLLLTIDHVLSFQAPWDSETLDCSVHLFIIH